MTLFHVCYSPAITEVKIHFIELTKMIMNILHNFKKVPGRTNKIYLSKKPLNLRYAI